MKLILAAFTFSLSLAAFAHSAQTYYIDPTGDDTRDGRTVATAWRSVTKVNSTDFAPGDVVSFARAGVWREPLKPKVGGQPGSPIVFTAHGSGAAPLFVGSDELAASGTRIATSEPVHAVLLDDAFLRSPTDYRIEAGEVILARPPLAGQRLRVIRRDDMIHLSKINHVVVRGLAVDATARMHRGYGFRIDGCRDVLLEDCTATRGGKHHFGIINSTEVVLRRCHASLVAPDQGVGGATAFVSYSDQSRRGDTSRYEDCRVEDYADAGKGRYPAFTTHGEGIGSVTISRLTSRGASVALNNAESGASLALEDSVIEDADLGIFGKAIVVRGVQLRRGVLTLGGESNVVENCTITELNPGFAGHQSAVVNTGKRNTLKSCTILLAEAAKPFNAAIAMVAADSALTWEDCTFGPNGAAVRTWFPDVRAANCRDINNKYPSNARFLIKGREKPLTVSEWQEFGLGAITK